MFESAYQDRVAELRDRLLPLLQETEILLTLVQSEADQQSEQLQDQAGDRVSAVIQRYIGGGDQRAGCDPQLLAVKRAAVRLDDRIERLQGALSACADLSKSLELL